MSQPGLLCVFLGLLLLLQDGMSQKTRNIPQKYTSHPHWKLLNVLDVCGRSAPTFVKKIVGGEDAKLGQFPWMAYLITKFDVRLKCGGSIINHRYILTAAHCGPDLARVRLGEYEYKDERVPTADCVGHMCAPPSQEYNIEQIMCHYHSAIRKIDDICLIRVDRNIQFNDFVKPICLPFYTHLQDKNFEGEHMEVAGWGTVNETISYPTTLQVSEVAVISKRSCTAQWRRPSYNVVDTQMCTQVDQEVPKATCHKDSGGPLMKRLKVGHDFVYFQFGIVSWGDGSCKYMYNEDFKKFSTWKPTIYTRVVSYLEWILDHIHE